MTLNLLGKCRGGNLKRLSTQAACIQRWDSRVFRIVNCQKYFKNCNETRLSTFFFTILIIQKKVRDVRTVDVLNPYDSLLQKQSIGTKTGITNQHAQTSFVIQGISSANSDVDF